jgi:hypothetical protein
MSLADFQEKIESFKEKYGIDIMSKEGRLLLKNELYRRDTVLFINDLVMIEDKDQPGIVIDFKLWPEQEDALRKMENNRFIIFLKARQLGISWLSLSFITKQAIYNEGFTATILTQTENNSKEMIRRIDFVLRHLPDWLIYDNKAEGRDKQKEENITGLYFETSKQEIIIYRESGESSRIRGATSSAAAAHGFTDNVVLLDEWARHQEAEEIWDAAYPTINRPTGGKVIGISTGIRGTFFEEMWENAHWEYGPEKGAGTNMFTGIFLPWYIDPRRDRKWYEYTKANMRNFKSQYPSTPSEAFSVGSGAAFPEWDATIHVPYGKDWYPPASWRVVFAYDGGWKQAAGIWFAISPDGWVIAYREYYPSYLTDPEQAIDIKTMSKDADGAPEQIDYMVADTSCWAKNLDSGKSTIEIMEEYGNRPWRQADKDRIMGWKRLHEWLTPLKDENGEIITDKDGKPLAKLRFTASCGNFIRIISGIREHLHKPDDIADGQEDHLLDCCRYFVMSRPRPKLSDDEKKQIANARQRRINPRSRVTGY